MRDTTERPEGLTSGGLMLAGTCEQGIYEACKSLLTDRNAYEIMCAAVNPFGEGCASDRIALVVNKHFGLYGGVQEPAPEAI